MARSKRFSTGIQMLDLSVKKHYGCMPQIPGLSHLLPELKKAFGEVEGFKTPTEVGIEIEVEKQTIPANCLLWKAVEDGSLKDAGKEYVSVPIKDEFVIYAIEEYDRIILKMNPKTEFSHRCSIHVHINASKLTVGQLRALIATYLSTESLFFALVGPDRVGNSYCYPLSDIAPQWTHFQPEFLSEHYKYAALNPHHLRDFGTLEFRHHGGTKDKKELLNWIETILQLYRFVESKNPMEVEEQIKQLNTVSNYFEFIKEVFGKKSQQFAGMRLYDMLRTNVTAAKVFLA